MIHYNNIFKNALALTSRLVFKGGPEAQGADQERAKEKPDGEQKFAVDNYIDNIKINRLSRREKPLTEKEEAKLRRKFSESLKKEQQENEAEARVAETKKAAARQNKIDRLVNAYAPAQNKNPTDINKVAPPEKKSKEALERGAKAKEKAEAKEAVAVLERGLNALLKRGVSNSEVRKMAEALDTAKAKYARILEKEDAEEFARNALNVKKTPDFLK